MKTTVLKKYESVRDQCGHGYIVLTKGKTWLAKVILWATNSSVSHGEIIWHSHGRILTFGMWKVAQPNFMSNLINTTQDFCVIKINKQDTFMDYAVTKILDIEEGRKYNYGALPLLLFVFKLPDNWFTKRIKKFLFTFFAETKDICTKLTFRHANIFPLSTFIPKEGEYPTPSFFLERAKNCTNGEVELLFYDFGK